MKQSKYWIKVVCGYRKDQEYTINANEAHKAYYLFNNPDQRGVFDNGLAIKGADIQRIVPDYNATMGWNATYQLTNDDWNEIERGGLKLKFEEIMGIAKTVAQKSTAKELQQPLYDVAKQQYPALMSRLNLPSHV